MNAIQNLLGWTEVQLSEISYRITKGTTPTSVGFNFTENGILFVKVESLSEQRINHNLCAFISSEADEALARSRFKENDILFSIAGTLGRIAIVQAEDLPANTNQAICIIRLIPPIFPKYIAQILSSHLLEDRIKEQRRGVGLQNLNLRQVSEFTIPLPPLNEQKRIVAKIEALQERSQRVKAELEAIRPLLNKFRQSVLAAAFRGDLTKDWREKNPDIEPASVLLERIKVKRFELAKTSRERGKVKNSYQEATELENLNNHHLPNRWLICTIGYIGDVCNGSTPSRKNHEYWKGEIAWVSSGEVDNNIINQTREHITEEGYKKTSVQILPVGTILLAMIGQGKTRGKTAILNIEATINQNIAAVILKHGLVLSEYLWYWFQYQYVATREVGSGSGPKALNCERVRYLPLVLAPLQEQKEIVNRIEKIFKIADNIEHLYQQTETDLETLNQSILAKAFRGELVPQNPNDEPASVLLERIRKERETDSKPAKQTRQKPPKTDNYKSTQLTLEGIE